MPSWFAVPTVDNHSEELYKIPFLPVEIIAEWRYLKREGMNSFHY